MSYDLACVSDYGLIRENLGEGDYKKTFLWYSTVNGPCGEITVSRLDNSEVKAGHCSFSHGTPASFPACRGLERGQALYSEWEVAACETAFRYFTKMVKTTPDCE